MEKTLDIVRENNGKWLLTLFIPIAILGKLVRWTLLKHTLVDMSIGHGMAPAIMSGHVHFALSFSSADATKNANFIFSALKIFGCSGFEQFELAISIIFNIIVLLMLYDFICRNNGLTLYQFIIMAFFIGVLNVYTFTLAKEPAQMIYFCFMYPIIRSNCSIRSKWLLSLAIIVLIIALTRIYFCLMLMFVIVFKLCYPWLNRQFNNHTLLSLLAFFLLTGVIYFLFLNFMKWYNPANFDELLRVRLRESDATTDIRAVIPSRSLDLFAINYIITAFRLLFPVEIAAFGAKYLLCVIFQMIISLHMVRITLNYRHCSANKQLAISLFWGFLLCSAAFEPDFGSWIRHESVTFPFLIYAFDNNDKIDSES